jgi:hypothetical protein
MLKPAKFPADWTEPERWAWEQIAAGEAADFNVRDRRYYSGFTWEQIAAGEPADFNARDQRYYTEFNNLDPCNENGWAENRRLRAKFLQAILTEKVFADATPYGGVRILGALVDDAPFNLEHARLQRLIWLEHSRIRTDVKCHDLLVDGDFSLEGSFVGGRVDLLGANVGYVAMSGATFEGAVNLTAAKVSGSANLLGATFKAKVDLNRADIGSDLDMRGATFGHDVSLTAAKVGGSVRGATFKATGYLVRADIASDLGMSDATFERVFLSSAKVGGLANLLGATFKAKVDLNRTDIGSDLDMSGATFEHDVSLTAAKVGGSAYLIGATFKGHIDLNRADIGSDLDFSAARLTRRVDMTGCEVKSEFRLESSQHLPARWGQGALMLRNAHVGVVQDWWQHNSSDNSSDPSWPEALELEGFTFDRLGGRFGTGKEAGMMARPSSRYVEWLGKDSGSSPQPYEHLASFFRRAGEPGKANDVLYEAREKRRRAASSKVEATGLWFLRLTIGYGLGNRYFRVLWWVVGLSFLGMFILIAAGSPERWPSLFFASLDQFLPVIKLNKAHDALIFGDSLAQPPVKQQPYWVLIYFYLHKIVGWVLGSFVIAGLAGLTQRN